MLTIQIEVDSRRLGDSSLSIPVKDAWLASHTRCEMLQQVLDQNSDGSDALVMAEHITLFCSQKLDSATGSSPCRSSMANASTCLDFTVLIVIDAFSTVNFAFKIVAKSDALSSSAPTSIKNSST